MAVSRAHGLFPIAPVKYTYNGGKTWSYIDLPWEDYDPNLGNESRCLEFNNFFITPQHIRIHQIPGNKV